MGGRSGDGGRATEHADDVDEVLADEWPSARVTATVKARVKDGDAERGRARRAAAALRCRALARRRRNMADVRALGPQGPLHMPR